MLIAELVFWMRKPGDFAINSSPIHDITKKIWPTSKYLGSPAYVSRRSSVHRTSPSKIERLNAHTRVANLSCMPNASMQ
jgi:hypothetical protein